MAPLPQLRIPTPYSYATLNFQRRTGAAAPHSYETLRFQRRAGGIQAPILMKHHGFSATLVDSSTSLASSRAPVLCNVMFPTTKRFQRHTGGFHRFGRDYRRTQVCTPTPGHERPTVRLCTPCVQHTLPHRPHACTSWHHGASKTPLEPSATFAPPPRACARQQQGARATTIDTDRPCFHTLERACGDEKQRFLKAMYFLCAPHP